MCVGLSVYIFTGFRLAPTPIQVIHIKLIYGCYTVPMQLQYSSNVAPLQLHSSSFIALAQLQCSSSVALIQLMYSSWPLLAALGAALGLSWLLLGLSFYIRVGQAIVGLQVAVCMFQALNFQTLTLHIVRITIKAFWFYVCKVQVLAF